MSWHISSKRDHSNILLAWSKHAWIRNLDNPLWDSNLTLYYPNYPSGHNHFMLIIIKILYIIMKNLVKCLWGWFSFKCDYNNTLFIRAEPWAENLDDLLWDANLWFLLDQLSGGHNHFMLIIIKILYIIMKNFVKCLWCWLMC